MGRFGKSFEKKVDDRAVRARFVSEFNSMVETDNTINRVFDANRDQLDNPDLIEVGQKLRIPA